MLDLAIALTFLIPALQESSAPAFGRRLQWAGETSPPAREHAAFVPEPERNRVVLLTGSGYSPYGNTLGDAWAFDCEKERWSELELMGDTIAPGGSRRAAPVDGGAYLHGGYGAGFAPLGGLWHVVFEEDVIGVESVAQENPPPARMLHAFACDADGERFVVFGGAGPLGAFGDTWIGERTEDGVRWQRLETEHHPRERMGFAFAHDAERDWLLVCGGQVPPKAGEAATVFVRDLWSLDFTAEEPEWTLLAEYGVEEFHGRRNPAFAFDDRTGDLFVLGGTGDGATALPDLYVVRTRIQGAPVERFAQPDGVPARVSSFGVIDEAGGRALLGFGNTAAGPYEDLVEVRLRRAK